MDASCQCGAVQFRTPDRPRTVVLCHCRVCRRQSSTAFAADAHFDGQPVFLDAIRSRLSVFAHGGADCFFCTACGTRVLHVLSASDAKMEDDACGVPRPGTFIVKGGVLANLDYADAVHVHTAEAVVHVPEDAVQYGHSFHG